MSQADNEFSLSLLKSNPSSSSRKRAVAEAKRNNDQVFMILYSDKLTYKDMKSLVSGFKNTTRAKDILMAYRILSTLMKYLDESESWSFNMLKNYDFQRAVRQFDLDVAIVVGARAERLLAEIYSWNIPHLKKTVMSFSTYASDDATILTVLVFRILNEYSTLEFTLQLALSRATLIKIHHEMSTLFSKLPGGADNSQHSYEERARNDALVNAYRDFVTSLLEELETTPFESVQQELFQIVRDLHSMFHKFSDSQQPTKSLEGSSDAQEPQTKQSQPQESQYQSDQPLDDLFQQKQEENFLNLNSSNASNTPSNNPPLSTLQEEWQNQDFYNDGAKTEKPRIPSSNIPFSKNHKRTVSNSTNQTISSSTMVSSLTEELPAMLHAFEVARRRKESLQHPNHQNANQSPRQNTTTGSEYALNTPPDTPSRSTMDTSFYDAGTNTPDSTSYMASPVSVERPKNKPRKKRDSGTPSLFGGSIKNQTPVAEVPPVEEQTVQVKMINGRMMMKVDGRYVDMQEWADKANTVTEVNAQISQHPSYSIANSTPSHHSMVGSTSNPNLHSVLHVEPASPSRSTSSAFSINTQDSASTSATSVASSSISASPKASDSSALGSGTSAVTSSTHSAASSGYGISTLFQPWFKPPPKAILPSESVDTKQVAQSVSAPAPVATGTTNTRKDTGVTGPRAKGATSATNDKPTSTLEYLQKQQQQNQNQPIQNQPQPVRAPSSMMGFPGVKSPLSMMQGPSSSQSVPGVLQAPAPAITYASQRAAMNSSSWIKGLIAPTDARFPKGYSNDVKF